MRKITQQSRIQEKVKRQRNELEEQRAEFTEDCFINILALRWMHVNYQISI
jgi:uncharacterized membrane-anchored protein YhcB (DUF1043 family)